MSCHHGGMLSTVALRSPRSVRRRTAASALTAVALVASLAACSGGDDDTADLFTEISRAVDKHLWFLEAHVQEPTGTLRDGNAGR